MNSPAHFANDPPVQLALRELSLLVWSGSFWVGFVCVIGVLVVSAPFDSGEEFTALQRVVYWSGVGLATFLPALVIIRSVAWRLVTRGVAGLPASMIGGLVAGVPVGLTVFAINSYIAGNDNGEFKDVYRLIFLCSPIAVAVAGLQYLVLGYEGAAPNVDGGDRLSDRIAQDARGQITTLQAQDHYVEVTTSVGTDLLLLRFSDALRDVADLNGRRVHRSWWVAHHAVDRITRDGHRMSLVLSDGRAIPVSRSNQKAVAGWLAL